MFRRLFLVSLLLCILPSSWGISTAEGVALSDLISAMPRLLDLSPVPWNAANISSVCDSRWTGAICYENSVYELQLESRDLFGFIPDSIDGLGNLTTVSLWNNSLTGTLPASLGNLTKVRFLYLDHNNFTGQVPPSIMALPALANMDLEHNSLSGSIIAIPGAVNSLEELYIYDNFFTGSLPATLANYTKLRVLSAQNNEFNETLPDRGPPALQFLNLASNSFTGGIPQWIQTAQQLISLDLSFNLLRDPLPQPLNGMVALRELRLHGNPITGFVPSLSGLVNLRELFLGQCEFEPQTLDFLATAPKLTYLFLPNSNFVGPLPDFSLNPDLDHVDLSYNDLNGTIPPSIFLHPTMTQLIVNNNGLTGSIPPQSQFATKLVTLQVGVNNLTNCFVEPPALTHCYSEYNPSLCSCRATRCNPRCSNCDSCPALCPPGSTCVSGIVLNGNNTVVVISGPTVIFGPFIGSRNTTTSITLGNSSATPLDVRGCAAFDGVLNLTLSEAVVQSGQNQSITLISFEGYCEGNQTRFSSLTINTGGCQMVSTSELQYSARSLSLVLGDFDKSRCGGTSNDGVTSGGLSPGAIGGIIAAAVAVLLVVSAVLVWRFRSKIIPSYSMARATRRLSKG